MATSVPAAPKMSPAQQNLMLRQALITRSPRQITQTGVFTETSPSGKTTRIKLKNAGVLTKIGIVVTANVTIGTAAATLSPKAPYNLLSHVRFTDFDNVDHVNCTGYQLWQLQSARNATPAYLNNEGTAKTNTMPSTPIAIGAQVIKFYLEIPIAYDPESDLRGAVYAQTGLGDMYLNLTYNSLIHANVDDDAVYNGAPTTIVTFDSVSVDVYQHFLQPQPVDGILPLPMLDLMTIYDINGGTRITDNLSNGQERLLNYPNARSVIGFYANWINNGIMSDAFSAVRLIANSNQIIQAYTRDTIQMAMRSRINGDFPRGTIYLNTRSTPVDSRIYGNVQMGVTFSAAPTGNFYLEQMVESFAMKGQALPTVSNQ